MEIRYLRYYNTPPQRIDGALVGGVTALISETELLDACMRLSLPAPIAQELFRAILDGAETVIDPLKNGDLSVTVTAWQQKNRQLPNGVVFRCNRETQAVAYFYWITWAMRGGATIEIGHGEPAPDHPGRGELRVGAVGSQSWIDLSPSGYITGWRSGDDACLDSMIEAKRAAGLLEEILYDAANHHNWVDRLRRINRVNTAAISKSGLTEVPERVVQELRLGANGGVMWTDLRVFRECEKYGPGIFLVMSDDTWCSIFGSNHEEEQ